VVYEAMTQRDVMRIGGEAALAASWQAIVDRHAKVLADRDRVIAWMLWDAVTELPVTFLPGLVRDDL
jgi:hypothetical protein